MLTKRTLIAFAVAVATASAAHADNESVAITGPTTVFNDTTPFAGGFIDVKSFTGLAAGAYTFEFGFLGFGLDLFGATFDGVSIPVQTSGAFSGGTLSGTFVASGSPILFALAGTAGAGAAYTGILNLTAVPEPETYALFLAGLGALGFMARRRMS
jgi:PEP-CTERM motif